MDIIKSTKKYKGDAKWEFTSLDKSCINMVIKGTWLYSVKLDADLLQNSLSELLDYYPHLTGRIKDQSYIEINNEGVFFSVIEKTNVNLEDIRCDKNAINRYSTGINLKETIKGNAPLFVVTLTHLKDGCVLSVQCVHACMDGSSFYTMMRNWGMITRKKFIIPPVLDQSLYPKTDDSLTKEVVVEKVKILRWKSMSFSLLIDHLFQSITGISRKKTEAIHISEEVIAKLKQIIGKESGKTYGTHAVLSAMITKICLSLYNLKNDEKCSVLSVVDIRGRIKNMPHEFVGNAVSNIPSNDFTANTSLADIAEAVDMPLKAMLLNQEKLEEYIFLNLYAMRYQLPFVPFDVKGMNAKRPTTIYLNNFSRFPMYDVDFGKGKPISIIPHDLPDAVKVFPTPDDKGVNIFFMGYLAKYYNKLPNKTKWLDSFLQQLLA